MPAPSSNDDAVVTIVEKDTLSMHLLVDGMFSSL
jgi:hypothetical protein